MGIIIGKSAPTDGKVAIARYLGEHQQKMGMRPIARVAAATDAAGGGISEGCRRYTVSLESLNSGNLLADARPGVWTYMVHDGESVAAELELEHQQGAGSRVVASHRGPSGDGTMQGLVTASQHAPIVEKDYEARVLCSPGIHLFALWFHADDDDILMAVPPDMTGLQHNQPLSPDEVAEYLKPLAETVVAQSSEDETGG